MSENEVDPNKLENDTDNADIESIVETPEELVSEVATNAEEFAEETVSGIADASEGKVEEMVTEVVETGEAVAENIAVEDSDASEGVVEDVVTAVSEVDEEAREAVASEVAEASESGIETAVDEIFEAGDDIAEKTVAAAAEPIASSKDEMETKSTASTASMLDSGIGVPGEIPGAPETVTPRELLEDGTAILVNSFGVLQRKPKVYEYEVQDATWWRYWLTVGTGALIAAVLYAIASIFFQFRLSSIGIGMNVLEPIFTLVFTFILVCVSIFLGGMISHWVALTQQNGSATMLEHCHTIAVAWLPGHVITTVIGVISIILFGGFISSGLVLRGGVTIMGALPFFVLLLGLISLVVVFFTLTIIVEGLRKLYHFESEQLWLNVIVFLIASGLIYAVLDGILPG